PKGALPAVTPDRAGIYIGRIIPGQIVCAGGRGLHNLQNGTGAVDRARVVAHPNGISPCLPSLDVLKRKSRAGRGVNISAVEAPLIAQGLVTLGRDREFDI